MHNNFTLYLHYCWLKKVLLKSTQIALKAHRVYKPKWFFIKYGSLFKSMVSRASWRSLSRRSLFVSDHDATPPPPVLPPGRFWKSISWLQNYFRRKYIILNLLKNSTANQTYKHRLTILTFWRWQTMVKNFFFCK